MWLVVAICAIAHSIRQWRQKREEAAADLGDGNNETPADLKTDFGLPNESMPVPSTNSRRAIPSAPRAVGKS
jgi:hypothetical protein